MKIETLFVLFAILLFGSSTYSQEASDEQIESYRSEVRDMVNFFEYMLNTLGDRKTSARDKDVIVTQSYDKIFRDGKVQVEDDLDENRDVITNKDVSAYLKDVNFFFKDVQFEFEIKKITHETNDDGNLFFKVAMIRNLKGLTVNNDSINNTIPRYVEVNYDPEAQDLKIVSIYTHEFNEKKALKDWWIALSYEWHSVFKEKYDFTSDSLSLKQIKTIANTDTLDISGNKYVIDINALANLTDLKVLSLANTNIADVTAIRNLTELEHLDLSNTEVKDISTLKYCRSLKDLQLHHTSIRDISVLKNMYRLESLNLQGTRVYGLDPIQGLKNLKNLNIEGSDITSIDALSGLSQLTHLNASHTTLFDIAPVAGLKQLKELNLDSTNITDLKPLSDIRSLEILSVNSTSISSLAPLKSLKNLTNLYCDNAPLLLSEDISDFSKTHPNVLIVYATKDIRSWWVSLNDTWRDIFKKQLNIGSDPSKEALAKLSTIDSLNLAGSEKINSIQPLTKLEGLKWLNIASTKVTDLSVLSGLKQLQYLNASYTDIDEISALKGLGHLNTLFIDSTQVVDLSPIYYIKSLKRVYADNTPISWREANDLLDKSSQVLVVFETDRLIRWWVDLSVGWRAVFKEGFEEEVVPTAEQLHKISQMEELSFSGVRITDLKPLEKLIRLQTLSFSNTGISDLLPLTAHDRLTALEATNSPVTDLSPLRELEGLKKLNIANTPVESLEALENLTDLREIDCSGTQIKRLNDLELLHGLEILNCANTRVKRLDPVQYLSLKELICYNTRVNDNRVEDFKDDNPACTVTFY